MSTIIIPGGGGAGLGIASLVGNLVALFILVMVIKYFWTRVDMPSKPFNIVDQLKKINIDATGLFGDDGQQRYIQKRDDNRQQRRGREGYTSDNFMKPAFPQ